MKTYKLIGLDFYTAAFSKVDAALVFLANKIGVLPSNIEETDIEPNRDAVGRVFRSLEDYKNFEIAY